MTRPGTLLLTGLNGSLAPRIAEAASRAGWQVRGWDRQVVAVDDVAAGERWLRDCRPQAIVHAAMGPAAWAGRLAAWAARHDCPLVYTSSAMVFDAEPDGPHQVADARSARDDYGRSKIAGEDAVAAAYPGASIARLGWQIDPQRPGNNMLRQLDEWQQQQGEVGASRAWTPACSFMSDTADALVGLLARPLPGVLHLDSNADEAHRFDAVVAALRQQFQRDAWRLRVHQDYRHDQRLVGGALSLPPLSARLPALQGA